MSVAPQTSSDEWSSDCILLTIIIIITFRVIKVEQFIQSLCFLRMCALIWNNDTQQLFAARHSIADSDGGIHFYFYADISLLDAYKYALLLDDLLLELRLQSRTYCFCPSQWDKMRNDGFLLCNLFLMELPSFPVTEIEAKKGTEDGDETKMYLITSSRIVACVIRDRHDFFDTCFYHSLHKSLRWPIVLFWCF